MQPFAPHLVLRQSPLPRLYPSAAEVVILEEPKPVSDCLEWRLGSRYWQHHGVTPFFDGSVPYVINNSGWAPRAAAELVIAAGKSCKGPLIVIEIASGSGIFARQALDHIKDQSIEKNLDIYARLTWVCTDNAELSIKSLKEREQFKEHVVNTRPA